MPAAWVADPSACYNTVCTASPASTHLQTLDVSLCVQEDVAAAMLTVQEACDLPELPYRYVCSLATSGWPLEAEKTATSVTASCCLLK